MSERRRERVSLKCYCGSTWVTLHETGRWERFVGWWKQNVLGDPAARFLHGPYIAVCSKCKKRRRELERRNYR